MQGLFIPSVTPPSQSISIQYLAPSHAAQPEGKSAILDANPSPRLPQAGYVISAEELQKAEVDVSEEELEGVAGGLTEFYWEFKSRIQGCD